MQRFAVPGPGSVNTYWIEGPQGLIIIDFQRDTVAAGQAIEAIRQSGRPIAAMLLTHAHPDHIGGLAQFKATFPDAPILASEASAIELRTDGQGYQLLTRKVLGDRAPSSYPAPDRLIETGKEISIAGLRVVPLEFGPGEAVSATVYYFPELRAIFAGDIAVAGMTDFLLEGRTGPWLVQLDRLAGAFPGANRLYPGHGLPGLPDEVIGHARKMLELYRSAVAEQIAAGQASSGNLSDLGQAIVERRVRSALGDLPPVALIPGLVRENAKAVARELTSREPKGTDPEGSFCHSWSRKQPPRNGAVSGRSNLLSHMTMTGQLREVLSHR